MAAGTKTVVTNRQALRDFFIEKAYEAGIQLHGNEVKSLRDGKGNLRGSFARVENGEVYIFNMHINPYKYSRDDYDPIRPRKLLLHKSQIKQLEVGTTQQGHTLVVLKIYFKKGYAKAEIAIGRGKKFYDKRQALKKKQADREMERVLSKKNK